MITVLSSAVGVAFVTGLFKLLEMWLTRRGQRKDGTQAITAALCQARGKELTAIKAALVAILYDRIKHLAKSHIARGYVAVEEYEDLVRMHGPYHDLGGNGFLDDLMKTVSELQKRSM